MQRTHLPTQVIKGALQIYSETVVVKTTVKFSVEAPNTQRVAKLSSPRQIWVCSLTTKTVNNWKTLRKKSKVKTKAITSI